MKVKRAWPGRAEEVHDKGLVDRETPEVHGDRCRRLGRIGHGPVVVHARGYHGHGRLCGQGLNLGNSSDKGGLADAKATGDHNLTAVTWRFVGLSESTDTFDHPR